MKPNIELAKNLLKEKYSITEDGKEFKLQYPIYVEDLAFIMQKYTEKQLAIDSVVVPKGTLCNCNSITTDEFRNG